TIALRGLSRFAKARQTTLSDGLSYFLIEELVGAQGQEFGELRTGRHLLEQAAGERELARRELTAEPLAVVLQNLPHHGRRHALGVGESRRELDPLPHLCPGNLGGRGIFHQ